MSSFGRGSKGGKDTLEARKAERLRTRYRRARRDRDSYRRFIAIQSLRGSCAHLDPRERRILAHKISLLHNQFTRQIYATSHQGLTELAAIYYEVKALYSFSQPKVFKAVASAICKVKLSFDEIASSVRRRATELGLYSEMCKGKTKNSYPEGESLLHRIASKSATWFKKGVCKVKQIKEELQKLSLGAPLTVVPRRIHERESWDFSELLSDAEIRANAPTLLFESDFELNRIREEVAPLYAKEAKLELVVNAKKQAWTDAFKSLVEQRKRSAKQYGMEYEEYCKVVLGLDSFDDVHVDCAVAV